MTDIGVLSLAAGGLVIAPISGSPTVTIPGVSFPVGKVPTFQTRIQRAVSGRELRALDYPYPLWQFTLVFNVLRDDNDTRGGNGIGAGFNELRSLMGFFMACQGAFATFLFDDPTDDHVTNQGLGVGDGVTTTFQLIRTFGGTVYFSEAITAPSVISNIYFDGVAQSPSIYSVNAANGMLTFTSPPGSGVNISADFSYYFRCRFVDDSYSFENFMYQLWQLKKMNFISTLS